MKPVYRVPLYNRLLRPPIRILGRGTFHILSRVRITGLENVPKSGPYIVAMNHISIFEPPLVLAFWPVPLEALGAVEIWERRGQAILVRLYGGIQLHRGQYDRYPVERVLQALHAGRPVLIAPEGGRTHTTAMREAHPGIGYIIDKTQAPVVPAGIVGSTDDFLARCLRGERPAIEMRIGRLFCLSPISGEGQERKRKRQENTDIVMGHIAALLPPEYQGVYTSRVKDVQKTVE
jgi:1-acyl-sn-glycerol-3-phosphate acyltransferase